MQTEVITASFIAATPDTKAPAVNPAGAFLLDPSISPMPGWMLTRPFSATCIAFPILEKLRPDTPSQWPYGGSYD